MNPLVSVVIPAYNLGMFVDASIQSALAQSFQDLEVIVVNDGSTDDTSQRLAAWTDARVRVIEQSNQGLAATLNNAIAVARGTYIGFLDADDLWLPGKLDRHLAVHLENPGLDVTFSWVRVIDVRGRILKTPCPRWRGPISFPQLLTDYAIRNSSAVVMRRDAVTQAGGFNSSLVRCIDFEFFLRVSLLRENNTRAVPEVLTLYRRYAGQRTADWRRMYEGWKQTIASIRPRAPELVARFENLAASNVYRYYASIAYEGRDFREAMRLVARGFSRAPLAFLGDPRNWKMGTAAVAGLILPNRALRALEKMAGYERPGG